MKENDLIRRADALKAFDDNIMWGAPRIAIMNVPAVEQPMSAVEYARSFAQMCGSHTCGKCPFHESEKFSAVSCVKFEREYPEESVAIVQKWAAENKAYHIPATPAGIVSGRKEPT